MSSILGTGAGEDKYRHELRPFRYSLGLAFLMTGITLRSKKVLLDVDTRVQSKRNRDSLRMTTRLDRGLDETVEHHRNPKAVRFKFVPRRVRHKQTAGELDVLKAVSNVDSQLRDRGRQLIVNLCLEGVFGGHKRPLRREKGRALRAHERGFIYW